MPLKEKLFPFALILLALPGLAPAEPYYGPYRATVVRVEDGDSLAVDVALWPGLTQRVTVRVRGIDTPEIHASDLCERMQAQTAMAATQAWVERHQGQVTLSAVGPDKYAGRVLAEVSAGDDNLGAGLLAAALAHPYQGGRRGGWCPPGAP